MQEISFLLDEHIPSSVARELKANDVNVKTVYEIGLDGRPDSEILIYAKENELVIVTQDSDFLKLDDENLGIVFLTEPLEIGDLMRQLTGIIEKFNPEEMKNSIFYIPWNS